MIESFPSRAYFVFCHARTGSGLLAQTLQQTGLAGRPFEYFVETLMGKPWLREVLRVPESAPFVSFRDWRDEILTASSEYGGVFAATVHWFQLDNALSAFRSDAPGAPRRAVPILRAFFPELRLVWLTRDNVVAQAISHHVAISTGVWLVPARRPPPDSREHLAPYDFAKIHEHVTSCVVALEGWREVLADAPELTMPLTYEQLADDFDGAVRKVFDHIGISLGATPVPPPILRKQAGSWSLELERRYREERRERGLGPVGDEGRI